MVPSLTAKKLLMAWSWENIMQVYWALGIQLTLCENEAKAEGISLPLSATFSNIVGTKAQTQNTLYLRSNRINKQIQSLDYEIARRKKLVGVLG